MLLQFVSLCDVSRGTFHVGFEMEAAPTKSDVLKDVEDVRVRVVNGGGVFGKTGVSEIAG